MARPAGETRLGSSSYADYYGVDTNLQARGAELQTALLHACSVVRTREST